MALSVEGHPVRILYVEDDRALREAVESSLRAVGFDVGAVEHGDDLATLVETFRPDAAILDVRLSIGPDGFELARSLRAMSGIPFLFLTASDDIESRLRGFGLGADDYLVKPFAMAELLARLNVILRRSGRVRSRTWEVRDLLVDEESRVAYRAGALLELTKTEFDLLCALGRTPGQTRSKVQLLSLVWGFDLYAPNLVEVHISALRRKLEQHGPRLIHTERGEGYVMRP
jgi:DNA-binding response OmpR family regulator